MRALLFDGSRIRLAECPDPGRRRGESLVRVKLAGICNTDIEIAKGYMGYTGILGHEFVGLVQETDTPELCNKRVVGEINVVCGSCRFCDAGMPTHCSKRTVVGIMDRPGVFAEFCTLPDANLHVVPESVSDEEAVFCEPLAAALEVTVQVPIQPDMRAVVLGDGKLGLLVAQALKSAGAKVLLVGHSPTKLSLAREWGLSTLMAHEVMGETYDIVVECTGSKDGFETALGLVRPRGTIVMKTTVAEPVAINLAPLVINEVTVVGSRCGPFKPALQALSEGRVRVREMITEIFPMERALDAFALASRSESIKVILRM